MEYSTQKYDSNEKLVLNIELWLLGLSIGLFILTVLMIENFDFLSGVFQVLATVGVIASAIMAITGNVRVIRYFIVIRKQDDKALIWKSALVMFLALISIFTYWFTLLILVFQSF